MITLPIINILTTNLQNLPCYTTIARWQGMLVNVDITVICLRMKKAKSLPHGILTTILKLFFATKR